MKKSIFIITGALLLIAVLFSSPVFSQEMEINCHYPKDPALEATGICKVGPDGDYIVLSIGHSDRSDLIGFKAWGRKQGTSTWLSLHAENYLPPSIISLFHNDVEEGQVYEYRVRAYNQWYGSKEFAFAEAKVPVCKEPPPDYRDCYFEIMRSVHGRVKLENDPKGPNWNQPFKFLPETNVQYGIYTNGKTSQFELLSFRGYLRKYYDEELGKYRYIVDLIWIIEVTDDKGKKMKIRNEWTDYDTRANAIMSYVLVFKCGPCDKWEFFGDVDLTIPVIKDLQ